MARTKQTARKSVGRNTSAGNRAILFSDTLQDITNTKLNELQKRKARFEEARTALTTKVNGLTEPLEVLHAWANGVRECFYLPERGAALVSGAAPKTKLEIDLQNIERFLDQARYDPSISTKVRDQWQRSMERHLDIQSLKYDYATLYGQLTTEWLSLRQTAKETSEDEDTKMDDFEHLPKTDKLESRSNWEHTVFEPAQVNQQEIRKMLSASFEPPEEDDNRLQKALETIRADIRDFEQSMASGTNFTVDMLRWVLTSLIASDLLTDEKREVLIEFRNNSVIQTEVADVLNMWFTALSSWSWGDEVCLEERRNLSGTSNIFMHEDLLQAIFLQYIGLKWSVGLKTILKTHKKTPGVWKSTDKSIPVDDLKRRDYYLGPSRKRPTVEQRRQKLYLQKFFLAQLPDFESQQLSTVDGEEEYESRYAPQQAPRKQLASRAARKCAPSNDHIREPESEEDSSDLSEDLEPSEVKNPMDIKQTLLHLLSTEILIKTRLHGEITCIRSRFDDLYPSLPHETILQVLEFFGVSKQWLSFFERFLQAPLRFLDEPTASPRTRRRGTPGSHVLSEFFSEAILYALDFRVNQSTGGELLWRMQDDIWFWSAKESVCESAWKSINAFADTMGLELSHSRSGCARMRLNLRDTKHTFEEMQPGSKLPNGRICWGMLVLNPESGRFEIDNELVDKNIRELARQLKMKSGSIFGWVQAWNAFASTFFTANFGKPANCWGRQHVDDMLAAHERIQQALFSLLKDEMTDVSSQSRSGSVVDFLKETIKQRFGITDLPDGYFFFPAEVGGLEIQNPFVKLLQVRDTVEESPEKILDRFESEERMAYNLAKEAFERGETHKQHRRAKYPRYMPKQPDIFFSFEEYTKYREELFYRFEDNLVDVFDKLLERPAERVDSHPTNEISSALQALSPHSPHRGILSNFFNMEAYWKWILQLYGPEMIDRFGGLTLVDHGSLPIGMVGLFRSGQVKWQD